MGSTDFLPIATVRVCQWPTPTGPLHAQIRGIKTLAANQPLHLGKLTVIPLSVSCAAADLLVFRFETGIELIYIFS
jgi:hypothetical protein